MSDNEIKEYVMLFGLVVMAGIWIEAYRLKFRNYKTIFGGHPVVLLIGLWLLLALGGIWATFIALFWFLHIRKKIKNGTLLPKEGK